MKSKSTTVMLLVAVIAIWGYVAFKIYSVRNGGQDESMRIVNKHTPENERFTDTFNLLLNYSDPFLKTPQKSWPAHKVKVSISNIQTSTNREVLPAIVYKGMVSSEKDKSAILMIDGRSYILRIGDTIQNLKVTNITKDELLLKSRGSKINVKKSN